MPAVSVDQKPPAKHISPTGLLSESRAPVLATTELPTAAATRTLAAKVVDPVAGSAVAAVPAGSGVAACDPAVVVDGVAASSTVETR